MNSPDEGFNWQRQFYEKMPLKTRQELLSAERIFPYEVVGQNEPADNYARNLRHLAQFYWTKFIYERVHGMGNLGDLERAEHLLDLAIRKIGAAFYLLNDMGNIHLEYYKLYAKSLSQHTGLDPVELSRAQDRARRCFEDSIVVQRHQLRAYFNLAYVEAELSPHASRVQSLRKAIADLREGLKHPNWERAPIPDQTCGALYNLGCYYARLAPNDPKAESACVAVLRKAARLGLISPLEVERDFHSKDGDFNAILKGARPETRSILGKLEKDLGRHYR